MIAAELHPVTRSGARRFFRQIHRPSGKPVRCEKTVAGVGPVMSEEILKGRELAKGDYRGGRGRDRLKITCRRRGEAGVAGRQPLDNPARPFASLLLAAAARAGSVNGRLRRARNDGKRHETQVKARTMFTRWRHKAAAPAEATK